jgi:CheY-like chemotaxis protein
MRKRPSVLVACERADDVAALATTLADAGFHPRYAANGQEALETLMKRRVDAVVMDADEPPLSGIVGLSFLTQSRFSVDLARGTLRLEE